MSEPTPRPDHSPSTTAERNAGDDRGVKTRQLRMHEWREWVSHILALFIVGSTIFCALWSFNFIGTSLEMEDAKALLAVMSGLSGVVIGYYFGRVPAEANAFRAQDQMQQMTRSLSRATTMIEDLEDRITSGQPVYTGHLRSVRRLISRG